MNNQAHFFFLVITVDNQGTNIVSTHIFLNGAYALENSSDWISFLFVEFWEDRGGNAGLKAVNPLDNFKNKHPRQVLVCRVCTDLT